MTDSSQFYLGYAHTPPTTVQRWLRRCVPVLLAIAGFTLGAFASAQQTFSDSTFAFGETSTLTGLYVADPYPALLVRNTPEGTAGTIAFSRVHLVGQGKIGAQLDIAPHTYISVSGTLIAREQQSMLEAISSSVETIALPNQRFGVSTKALGTVSLQGEIVDSKCHLGVMKPGEGATHRACAVRCISGGLPPMLVTRNNRGGVDYFLLSGEGGSLFDQSLLAFVGKPVQIDGNLEQRNGATYLNAPVSGITLL